MWVVFFGLRLLLQINLFRAEAASLLGIAQLLTGRPATILLLIFDPWNFASGGKWLLAGISDIVAVFAILQIIGLRRYQATQRVGPGVPFKAES